MSKHPPATREDHDAFCATEVWDLVRGATGKPVTHHRTYELSLPDGRILRTRISRPINTSEYGKSMWSHILKTQLEVSVPVFRNCVNNAVLPNRGVTVAPEGALPLYLLRELIDRFGISPEEASRLTVQEAEKRVARHWQESTDLPA